jgi:aurora kinase
MADSLTLKMRGLAVSSSQQHGVASTSSSHHSLQPGSKIDRALTSASNSAGLPRIAPVITKYRNPELGKLEGHANTSKSIAQNHDAPRAALMRLAGGAPNFDRSTAPGPSNLAKVGSPKRQAPQHSAHGIHGPAHGTAARTLASKIASTEIKKVAVTTSHTVHTVVHEKRSSELPAEVKRSSNAREYMRKSDMDLDLPFKS